MKRILIRTGIGAAGVAGLLMLLCAIFLGWVQGDSGRAWLAGRIAQIASAPGEREVTVGHLGGNLFRRISLRDVRVKDASDVWLAIRAAEISWTPESLLRGRLHLRSVRLSGVRIDRLPASSDDEPGSPLAGLPSMRRLPSITVEGIAVDDLSLGAPVLGVAAVLQIDGAVKSDSDNRVSGTLSVDRRDGPLGKLRLTADYRAADGHLGIDLEVAEAAGGLMARALNVPALPALRASLKGAAPLAAWRARSEIAFGDVASAAADIAIQSGPDVKFQLAGDAKIPLQDPAAPRSLWSGAHRYSVSGRYDTGGLLEIDAAEWEGDGLQLKADGRLNLDDMAVDARGTVRSKDGRRVPDGPPHAGAEQVELQATLTKSLFEPDVALKFDIGRLDVPGSVFSGLTGEIGFRTTETRDGQVSAGAIVGSGSVTAVDIADGQELADVLRRPMKWTFDGAVDLEKPSVEVRALSLGNGIADLTGAGSFSMDSGTGAASVTLGIKDLLPIGKAYGRPTAGTAALSLKGTIAEFGDVAEVALSGTLSGLAPMPPIAEKMIAGGLRIGGSVSLKSNVVAMRDVSVASDMASLDLNGRIPLDGTAVDATYQLNIKAGALSVPEGNLEVRCSCTVTGKIAGQLTDPESSGDMTLKSLAMDGRRLDALTVRYDVRGLVSGPKGQVRAEAKSDVGPIALRTDTQMEKDLLRLSALHFEGAGATLDGAVAIPLGGAPMTGDFRFKVATLRPGLKVAGVEGDGNGTGRFTLSANAGRQRADATVYLANFRIEPEPGGGDVHAERVSLTAASDDLFAARGLSLKVDIGNLESGAATLERLSISATGSPERAEIELQAAGRWVDPLTARAALVFSGKGDRYDIRMNTLAGTALGRKFALGRPFRLQWDRRRIVLDDFMLASDGASAAASVKLTDGSVDGTVTIAKWPLGLFDRLWSSGMAGTLNATAAIRGTRTKPQGTLAVDIPNLRLASESPDAAFAFAVTGDWRAGRMLLKGRLSKPGTPAAILDADLPLRLATDRWGVVLQRQAPIAATAKWNGDIATLWKFMPFAWHELAGPGRIDAAVSGTVGQPKVQGRVTIENGTYESLQLGTVLKSVNLAMAFDGTKATLTKFSGNDGGSGTVAASGFLTLDPVSRNPFEFDLTLERFHVARRDDLEASASGKITAKGVLDAAKITGRLKTDAVELRVLNQLPPEIVDLEVVEEGQRKDRAGAKGSLPEPRFDPVLDIVVELPGRVFVRGRGIDSEWKGRLALAGTLQDPSVSGTLDVVRGQMSVIGKVFRVTKGTVVLPESAFAEPELLLTATHEGKRLTAEAHAAGPITKPKITLSSSPDLPQDEIVSQILFNKSATRLSGVEAAQLALALAQLSGAGGGPGFLDFARKTLGVDVLRIETAETENGGQPTVGAGKYLTEEVYIGVKQGATPESGSVGVQVEVTPNITVESEMRRSGESDVGVQFKLDY